MAIARIVSARVNVWMPTGFQTTMGIGHGSLELRTQSSSYYITWIGGGGNSSSAAEGHRATGFKQLQDRKTGAQVANPCAYNQPVAPIRGNPGAFNYEEDCLANQTRMKTVGRAEANYRILIPCKSPTGYRTGKNMWGLNATAIERWWIALMNLPPGHPRRNYKALSTKYNCNAAVVEGLREGGLSVYATPPKNFVFQGTATLVKWVNAAVLKINLLNSHADAIFDRISKSTINLNEIQTIPSLAEWKSDSHVGTFARRKEQVAEIDRLLPIYHSAKNRNDLAAALETLVLIQEQVYSHISTKPNSDRAKPMLRLAGKIYYVISDG